MAGLHHQMLFYSCIFFSVATLTTAVPLDRRLGHSSDMYTKKNVSLDSENVCMIDDVLYQAGDAIPTASPCEKCVCRPPGFACSIITCEKRPNCRALQRSNQCCPEYKCDCEHEGKVYHNGQKLDNSQNPCKVCYCQGGEVACTVIECYTRHDCIPRHVPGMCCPKYENCPPRDPARSASSSIVVRVRPANVTTARENQTFREAADDSRLNLLGEPEATGEPLPENLISNNIYELPQGDDAQVYEAYDSSSSTSTTGYVIYDDEFVSTIPSYYSFEEISNSTSSSSSTTGETTPWTAIPTFPSHLQTLGPEWAESTSGSTSSTEYIPTWGTYTEPESANTLAENTSASPASTFTEESTSSADSTDSSSSTGSTDSTLTTTTYSYSPISDDFMHGTSNNTVSTVLPFLYPNTDSSENIFTAQPSSVTNPSSNEPTATSSTDETTTSTTVSEATTTGRGFWSLLIGSGDGKPGSNCVDGSEDCDHASTVDYMDIIDEFNSSAHGNSNESDGSISLQTESSTDISPVTLGGGATSTIPSDEIGTEPTAGAGTAQQEHSSASNVESEMSPEASAHDIAESEATSSDKSDSSITKGTFVNDVPEIMAADMAQSDQEGHEEASTVKNDVGNDAGQPTTQTTLLDELAVKSNKTVESARIAMADSGDAVKESSDDLLNSGGTTVEDAEDVSSTGTTETNTRSTTEGDGSETSAPLSNTDNSSGITVTESAVTDSSATSTVSTVTETPESTSIEMFPTTQSQSTTIVSDSTTMETSS